MNRHTRRQRWIGYAACAWAALFTGTHVWWALGFSAGFPGGATSHQLWMSGWRYLYLVAVIVLGAVAMLVALAPGRPPGDIMKRWIPRSAPWIAGAVLTLRGIAGFVVDGTSDPVWWPTFLVGGMLFTALAWSARPGRTAPG